MQLNDTCQVRSLSPTPSPIPTGLFFLYAQSKHSDGFMAKFMAKMQIKGPIMNFLSLS